MKESKLAAETTERDGIRVTSEVVFVAPQFLVRSVVEGDGLETREVEGWGPTMEIAMECAQEAFVRDLEESRASD